MKVLIMGCGRVGAYLASMLDAEGHGVTILDIDDYSFRRLSSTFNGRALLGDGTDDETLQKAGIADVQAFVALTQGDNRNIMASQIAQHIFHVPRVICRIYDPLRRDLYSTMGIETYCPTTIFSVMLKEKLES